MSVIDTLIPLVAYIEATSKVGPPSKMFWETLESHGIVIELASCPHPLPGAYYPLSRAMGVMAVLYGALLRAVEAREGCDVQITMTATLQALPTAQQMSGLSREDSDILDHVRFRFCEASETPVLTIERVANQQGLLPPPKEAFERMLEAEAVEFYTDTTHEKHGKWTYLVNGKTPQAPWHHLWETYAMNLLSAMREFPGVPVPGDVRISLEIRSPHLRRTLGTHFHQDSSLKTIYREALVYVQSKETSDRPLPTQFALPGSSPPLFVAVPLVAWNDVVIFDNDRLIHRTPPGAVDVDDPGYVIRVMVTSKT
jgi:hypothetical protein